MSKSKSIAVPSDGDDEGASQWLALRPDSEIREAIEANMRPGERLRASDLPRVPTPSGGGTVWSWVDAGNNEQSSKTIDGLLVYYGCRGTLWGSEEPAGKTMPVLVTNDLITAVRLNDDIGDLDEEVLESCRIGDRTYDWVRLPYNKFKTGKNGVGKRCKESRLLAILRKDEAWPLLVSAGPGSLATVVPFVTKLAVPHFRANVSLTLQRVENSGGTPFSRIVPKFLGAVSREEGAAVRQLYTLPLSEIAAQVNDDSGKDGG